MKGELGELMVHLNIQNTGIMVYLIYIIIMPGWGAYWLASAEQVY